MAGQKIHSYAEVEGKVLSRKWVLALKARSNHKIRRARNNKYSTVVPLRQIPVVHLVCHDAAPGVNVMVILLWRREGHEDVQVLIDYKGRRSIKKIGAEIPTTENCNSSWSMLQDYLVHWPTISDFFGPIRSSEADYFDISCGKKETRLQKPFL